MGSGLPWKIISIQLIKRIQILFLDTMLVTSQQVSTILILIRDYFINTYEKHFTKIGDL
jgi:hypothetical protein